MHFALLRTHPRRDTLQAATASRKNPAKFWQYVKRSSDKHEFPALKSTNGVFVTGDVERANLLLDCFSNCQVHCESHCAEILLCPMSSSCLPRLKSGMPCKVSTTKVSSGSFSVTNKLIRAPGSALIAPFKLLFNHCLLNQHFPEVWKKSYITPIPKLSQDQTLPNNWRPISSLNHVSKSLKGACQRS